ncbi:TolC family protein [Spirosoma foliorum]|uniref:TolC family protein n=1 Tax=Spirosoma foliorum TaxID=2710596 RepID=A0A7G5GNK5_9BACT|nr:TolC family protein [Spirosoma foliorum]QMW00447.1 TolC family protein [Spirosoma foliorum]
MKLSSWLFFTCIPTLALAQQPTQPAQTPIQRALRNATIVQQGEVVTLANAIQTALAQNYQIKITQTQQQIAAYNNTLGNAGFLPVLSGNLTNNNSNQHIRQSYLIQTTQPTDLPGVISKNTTASVNLNWNIFNGFATFYVLDQLKELVRISEVNTRANIEGTLASVATGYYNVVRQLQRLLAVRQALDISQYRLDLAKTNFEVGSFSKVDYLTAQVDYNVDSASLIGQQLALSNAKILLNTLLVRDPTTEFAVQDTIIVRSNLVLEQLRESLLSNNPLLAAAVLNRKVADLNIKLAEAQQYPTVNLLSGYAYTAVNNQAGGTSILATARNNGLTYGIQASVPIFNGFNLRRQKQVATANALNAEYQTNNQRVQLELALNQTFQQYRTNLQLLSLEVQNYKITTQNVDIAYDRYRLGTLTAVGFRDVQRNLLDAQLRLIDAEYNAKTAEIELLRLSSTITQELGRQQ